MKGTLLFFLIFAVALLAIPMIAIGFNTSTTDEGTAIQVHAPPQAPDLPERADATEPSAAPYTPPETVPSEEEAPDAEETHLSGYGVQSFAVLDLSTGEIITVPLRDYVRGAVAAEMPPSFHLEALKAQAVAAHTYALYQHQVQQNNPDPALGGADFTADPANHQGFITEAEARDRYGDSADLYWDKICEAVDSVLPYILEYNDQPIVAAYHAMSAGQTEDASNVWAGEAPYLQAADSIGDLLAADFEATVSLSAEDVRAIILSAWPEAELSGAPGTWFSGIRRSDSGYITRAAVGGVELHGLDIRTAFNLRSHNVDIEYNESTDRFLFTTYGYGHGVGLSQYGADFMARQGSTFDEILRNYYTGATLKTVLLEEIL